MPRIFLVITICFIAFAANANAGSSANNFVAKKRLEAQKTRNDALKLIARYKNSPGTRITSIDSTGALASNSGANIGSDAIFEPDSLMPAAGNPEEAK